MRIRRRFATGHRDANAGRKTPAAPKKERRAWGTLLRVPDRRFAALATLVLLAAVGAGYAGAALILFPAPIFAESSTIPNLRDLTVDAARDQLAEGGFRMTEGDRLQHPDVRAGAIAWQDPPPGLVAPEGTEVQVHVSAGPQRVAVPDVAGYDQQLARTLIEAAGLTVGGVESAPAPTPADVAVNTRPPAGSTLPPGAAVTLVVSVGAATIRVPNVMGRFLEDARALIEEAGLELGEYYLRREPGAVPGTVIEQRPAPGTLSAPGAAVELRLARRANGT